MTEGLAQTLTELQQRRSFSGPKSIKGLGRSVRNVLAKPYAGFWPLADSQAESELQELLALLLPAARKLASAEDLKLLRKMKGKKMEEDRAKLRQTIWENNPGSKENRQNLIIGVNDVSRALEENTLASLLISNEADPPILTRYLGTLAATRNVPFLVLQNLKKYTKEGMDISSLAVGLKKLVAEDKANHYHSIHMKIVGVCQTIAEKSVSINLKDVASSDLEFPIKLKEAMPSNLQGNAALEVLQSPVKRAVTTHKTASPSEIHLVRTSRRYRVFVPGQGMNAGDSSTWSQYISLSDVDKSRNVPQSNKSFPEVLGSSSVPDTRSFLQKVRDAKKAVLESSSVPMETDTFMSLTSTSPAAECRNEVKTEVEIDVKKEPVSHQKPVKRYFSTLAPLKVKRIQSNPQKVKKNQKGKNT